MKAVDGGKAFNITMRCTKELKERLEAYHMANFGQVSFNNFLGQLLEWQIKKLEGDKEVESAPSSRKSVAS